MKKSYLLLCLCMISSLPQAFPQTRAKTGSVSDIRFIEGSWKALAGDRSIDAVWSAPAGENMVGYVRVMREGKVMLYELFAFEQTEEGLVVMVRHFTPGLIAREEKEKPDRYTFMESGDGYALFQKEGQDVVHAAQRMHLVVSSKTSLSSIDCSRSRSGGRPASVLPARS